MASVRSSKSTAEFAEAVSSLNPADKARLRQIAIGLAFCCGMDAEDLLHEAVLRTLAGKRNWPADIGLLPFLAMTMKSIASGEREKEARRKAVAEPSNNDDAEEAIPDSRPQNPEEAAIQREGESEFYSLFSGDEAAEMIALGMVEGLEGEDLRKLVNLDKTAFNSKRRMVRRKINRAYMVGNDNV